MSTKKKPAKPELIAEDEATPTSAPEAPETHEPEPAPVAPVAVAAPSQCQASKADKQCTLALGHPGHHHHVPAPGTIDAIVSWP